MQVTRKGRAFDVAEFPIDDDGWFWNGFQHETWEPESFDVLDQFLTPGSLFVDIGAWIGPLTLWAATACGAEVSAVEPDPVAFSALLQNVHRNDLEASIDPYGLAISDARGTGRLGSRDHDGNHPKEAFGNSMSGLDNGAHSGVMVETMTIDGLWARCGFDSDNVPALVKIDIEGGEARLVNDARFLRQYPLLLSVHGPWMTPADQKAVSEAFDVDATRFGSFLVLP